VTSASTLVLEGAGGIGQDVIQSSVSYVLSPNSEIEVLRTTNDRGKTAINLTGNDFGQMIVGNAAANVLEGKGGADQIWGGAGNDRFVLSKSAVTKPDGSQVDHIMDYANGDVVDVTQVLAVAAGVNVISAGYLRVTTGGLIQVDLDGGANNWVTLSTINGSGSVSVRYLSGNSAATLTVARVADASALTAQSFQEHGHLSLDHLSLFDHDSVMEAPLFL
jgi:Ca2+-binding RTX toxin-like protein